MSKSDLGVLDAIELAIEAELMAKNFYSDSVAKASNDRGKDLLRQLSDFEQKHYEKLGELKKSLNDSGKFIDYKGTEFNPVKKTLAPIKLEENKDEVLNILKIAIDAEAKAYQQYVELAEMTSDPKGKDMFEKLASEEKIHRQILSDEFYQMSNRGGIWFWGD